MQNKTALIVVLFLLRIGFLKADKSMEVHCMCNRTVDSLALVQFYNALGGANWNTKWNLTQSMNTWTGITLDPMGCVKSIFLPNNNLVGELPSQLGNLANLSLLFLFNNSIFGFIPPEIAQLSKLEDLVLESNDLSGQIPAEIGNIFSLRFLNLANNTFVGEIPANLYNLVQLRQLNLSSNFLSGSLSADISKLTMISIFDVGKNRLSGSLPTSLSTLPNIRELYLNENKFSGEVPSTYSNLTTLVHFWLNNNNFTGAVPDVRNSPLNSFRIENNKFNTIPDYSTVRTWGNQDPFGLVIYNNDFTFEDLIPLYKLPRNYFFKFDPQNPIHVDPILYVPLGSNYAIRLNIDAGLPDNNYKWFKDTSLVFLSNRNVYELIQVTEMDEGMYSGVVNNPVIPEFNLSISKFRVVVTDPTKCDRPQAGNYCGQAPKFCSTLDLHNYCSALSLVDSTVTNSFLCDSSKPMDNPKWLSFVATKDSMLFEVFPKDCSGVVINGTSHKGMQASIWASCSGSASSLVYCISDCQNSPFTIGGKNIRKGQSYYLALDGCEGDVCEYQIKVLEGKSGFALDEPNGIIGDLSFCSDTLDHFFHINSIPGAQNYYWSINDTIFSISQDSFLNIKNLKSGIYKLSVYAKSDCDSTQSSFIVFQIFPPILFGIAEIQELGFDSAYIIKIKLTGGVPPYTITKGHGRIESFNMYISDPIVCKTNYTVEITDFRSCPFSYSVQDNCGCNSFAGTMPQDTLYICEGQIILAKYDGNEVRDSGDVSTYILYTDAKMPFQSILKNAPNGIFVFDPATFRFNIPYYISRASSRSNSRGQVDFLHPCLSISNAQVVYFKAKPIISAGVDKSFCGLEGVLSAFGTYTSGMWKKISGPGKVIIDFKEEDITSIQVDTLGVYVFSWEATNGFCGGKDEVKITFKEIGVVEIKGKLFVCNGQSTVLDAGPGFKEYHWLNGKQSQKIVVDSPGTYCVLVVDQDDCSASTCVQVSSSTAPVPVIHAPDTICTGRKSEINLTQKFDTYAWSTGDTTAIIFVDTGRTYCVTVTANNGCTADDCVSIFPKPRSYSTFRDTNCYDVPYFYQGKTYNEPGTHTISFPNAGRNGCDSAHLLILDWYPELILRDSIVIHDTGTGNGSILVRMFGGKMPYKYEWSNGKKTIAIDNLRPGTYSVLITDANNCTISFTFQIKIKTYIDNSSGKHPLIKIYPNPTQPGSTFVVETQNVTGKLAMNIYSLDGQHVYHETCELGKTGTECFAKLHTPPARLRAGIYIIQFSNNQGLLQHVRWVVL